MRAQWAPLTAEERSKRVAPSHAAIHRAGAESLVREVAERIVREQLDALLAGMRVGVLKAQGAGAGEGEGEGEGAS